jgi:hypothetical protein
MSMGMLSCSSQPPSFCFQYHRIVWSEKRAGEKIAGLGVEALVTAPPEPPRLGS